jgi:hypothetical protein
MRLNPDIFVSFCMVRNADNFSESQRSTSSVSFCMGVNVNIFSEHSHDSSNYEV